VAQWRWMRLLVRCGIAADNRTYPSRQSEPVQDLRGYGCRLVCAYALEAAHVTQGFHYLERAIERASAPDGILAVQMQKSSHRIIAAGIFEGPSCRSETSLNETSSAIADHRAHPLFRKTRKVLLGKQPVQCGCEVARTVYESTVQVPKDCGLPLVARVYQAAPR